MASSGNFETKFAGGYYIGVDWKQTEQNTTNNTSKVTATVYIRSTGSSYTISSSAQKAIKVVIDGTTYSGTNTVGISGGAKKNLLTASKVVSHNSDGNKSCAISCSATININFSSGYQGTVSSSGTATLNKNNLNSAPYFDSGAYVTIRENNSTGRVISGSASGTENANKYPENVANLYVSWPAVKDKETTSGVTYVLMCQANESSWWEQWRGSGTSYTHGIGAGNQNQSIDYYVYAIDNGGLKSGNIDALQVQKNKFTAATLSASGSIVHSTGNQTITISRSGASNTYTGSGAAINYNLSAKINSTNITVYNSSASGNLTIVPGTQTVSNPHIRLGDIRNAVKNSSYNGTLTLTLSSSNNWGSSGTSSKDISVDLRTNPVAGANGVSIDSSSYYAVPNGSATVNSIVPARKKIKLVWSAASDPNGTPITYRVEQQIGTGSWTSLTSSTSNTYYEFNANVSGKPTYKWRVYAKNSYGREILLSGTPSAILYNYSAPSISVKSTVRTANDFTINFSTAISTELAGNSIKSITLNYGGKDTSISTTATSAKLTGLSENSTGAFKLTIVDIHGATFGVASGVADGSIPQFYPVLSIRKNGVGVKTIPDGSADFMVGGSIQSKAENIRGYQQRNPEGNYVNQWVKIATLRVPYQYGDCGFTAMITGEGSGDGRPTSGRLVVKLKQQNAMGSAPSASLYLYDEIITNKDCFKMVITTNSATETIGEVWFKNIQSYESVYISPLRTYDIVNFHEFLAYQTALPSGTQFNCSSGGASALSVYPVGSIYLSVNSTNPSSYFGGTWVAWGSGRVPVGVNTGDGDFNTVEKQGGAKTVTLTTAQMPSHTHTQNSHNHSQNAHTHTQNSHNHNQNAHSHGTRYKGFSGVSSSSSGFIMLRRNDSVDSYDGTDSDGAISTTASNKATTATNQNTTATNNATTATNQNTGGGGSHPNLQPYITCYMWKRTA